MEREREKIFRHAIYNILYNIMLYYIILSTAQIPRQTYLTSPCPVLGSVLIISIRKFSN